MINSLKRNFYKIPPTALKKNSNHMTSTYNINQPFDMVIDLIKIAVNFSYDGRFPNTPEQAATTTCSLIFLTWYFTDSCQRWNLKPSVDKKWETLNTFFQQAPNLAKDSARVCQRHLSLGKCFQSEGRPYYLRHYASCFHNSKRPRNVYQPRNQHCLLRD